MFARIAPGDAVSLTEQVPLILALLHRDRVPGEERFGRD